MAVYRRGYQRYRGQFTGELARLFVLPRFAWKRLLEQRLVVIILVISLFWPLACATFIYVSNHAELWGGLDRDFLQFLRIDGNFFVVFMNAQAFFAIVLAAFAGPSLIAPDLSNGALPLYFSRPLSRTEYVLARLLVLVGLLSPVTWIPGLLLFGMQWGMAGWTWFSENWQLGAGVFAGFLLWIVFVAFVAMASSAYVKWRVVAGALVFAFYFVTAAAAAIINNILRVDWGRALNPGQAMNQVWRALLGAEPMRGPGAAECLLSIGVMTAILLLVLERKLRPVEVIS
jgi:ABC-2 type transport system permease protein